MKAGVDSKGPQMQRQMNTQRKVQARRLQKGNTQKK